MKNEIINTNSIYISARKEKVKCVGINLTKRYARPLN